MKKPKSDHAWEKTPGDFFSVLGPFLRPLSGNEQAATIIEEHDLNRPAFIERRAEHMNKIKQFADLWIRETNPALKGIIKNEMLEAMGDDKILAFFGREFAKVLGAPSE